MKLLLNINTMQKFIIKSFVFLGPIGTLIPSFIEFNAFRFYYFLLPIGIFLFLWKSINRIAATRVLILLPLLFYIVLSASVNQLVLVEISRLGDYPLFRVLLVLSLLIFSIFAGTIAVSYDDKTKFNLITLYISGYIVSLISGYILYIGYYNNLLSAEFIARFHVIYDDMYAGTVVRFSPGSQANEYGIVSSFVLSLITFLIMEHKKLLSPKNKILKIFFLLLLFILIFVALILTTTRAAYIAYLLSLLYLIFKDGNIKRIAKMILYISVILILFISWMQEEIRDIYIFTEFAEIARKGLEHTIAKGAIDYSRFERLQESFDIFTNNPFWGIGFGTITGTWVHNTYMQLLIELGTIGIIVLIVCIVLFILHERNKKIIFTNVYFKVIVYIATMHVLWFAASNHNLNHHLTWFCLFLYLTLQEDSKYDCKLYFER